MGTAWTPTLIVLVPYEYISIFSKLKKVYINIWKILYNLIFKNIFFKIFTIKSVFVNVNYFICGEIK